MDVAARLQKIFDVSWYRDLPTQPSADFETLLPEPGDIVMAFNLYGLRTQSDWQAWHRKHPDIVLLEDHSHDPFSDWAKNSDADYAFASLRKTLPIPDGGILWSPRKQRLVPAWGSESSGTAKRLKAMRLKHQYLTGGAVEKKQYRELEIASQNEMGCEENNLVSEFTRQTLPQLDVARLRAIKAANIRIFLELASQQPNAKWKPLFLQWDPSTVPLNAILLFEDEPTRNRIRAELIQENIFTAVHWLQPNHHISSGDDQTIEVTKRVLTIPLDARYDADDVRKVYSILAGC